MMSRSARTCKLQVSAIRTDQEHCTSSSAAAIVSACYHIAPHSEVIRGSELGFREKAYMRPDLQQVSLQSCTFGLDGVNVPLHHQEVLDKDRVRKSSRRFRGTSCKTFHCLDCCRLLRAQEGSHLHGVGGSVEGEACLSSQRPELDKWKAQQSRDVLLKGLSGASTCGQECTAVHGTRSPAEDHASFPGRWTQSRKWDAQVLRIACSGE
eukprot:5905083-Amphidinium_carterae.3